MHWPIPLLLSFIVSFALSVLATKFLIGYLTKRQIMDTPNERSNHKTAVPRGGGIAVIGTILAMYGLASTNHPEIITNLYPLLICPFVLATISFMDDIKPLRASTRFITQIIIISFAQYVLFGNELLFLGLLPAWLDACIVVVLWLWFINLFNFMDGIDGISSVETLFICLGIIAITVISTYSLNQAFLAAVIAGPTLGFLRWNWHPAKIFMGDVGSIPLGFLLGYLLLNLAYSGYAFAAIILPLYYLSDSTYTILKRLLQKKKIWQPHSEHFYQTAVRSGQSHCHVVYYIALTNIFLFAFALASVNNPNLKYWALGTAFLVVTALLIKFKKNK